MKALLISSSPMFVVRKGIYPCCTLYLKPFAAWVSLHETLMNCSWMWLLKCHHVISYHMSHVWYWFRSQRSESGIMNVSTEMSPCVLISHVICVILIPITTIGIRNHECAYWNVTMCSHITCHMCDTDSHHNDRNQESWMCLLKCHHVFSYHMSHVWYWFPSQWSESGIKKEHELWSLVPWLYRWVSARKM